MDLRIEIDAAYFIINHFCTNKSVSNKIGLQMVFVSTTKSREKIKYVSYQREVF